MNIMSKTIKTTLGMLLLVLSISGFSYAQEIDSVVIDGKQYYVYPFRKEVRTNSQYKYTLNTSKEYSNKMNEYYNRLSKGDTTVTIEELKYMASLDEWVGEKNKSKDLSRKAIKAMRKNPYPLLIQRYSLESDIIPLLDPIPDGDYIQLFEDFCLTDEKGKCQFAQNTIAGKFSFENNMLHGEAMWFNLQGDTLKHGFFHHGLREGVWKLEERRTDYNFSKKDQQQYIAIGHPSIDTSIFYFTYSKGAKNGPFWTYEMSDYPIVSGEFTDGVESGHWEFRDKEVSYGPSIGGIVVNLERIENRNNDIVTESCSIAPENKTTIVRQPWIRKGLISIDDYDSPDYDFFSEHPIKSPPQDLFYIAFDKEEELDLEEEQFDSYTLEDELYGDFEDYDYRYDEYEYGRTYGPEAFIYDPVSFDRVKRGLMIDSIGMIPNYTGKIEATYFNGQKAYSYNFIDGKVVEDTIFWSNGIAHDVITKIADSNYFLRSIYDVNGKLYQSLIYDSLGDFVDYDFYYENEDFVEIDGLQVNSDSYGSYYRYYNWDTLDTEELKDPVVVYASWSKRDLSKVSKETYYPESKRLVREFFGASGKRYKIKEYHFGDDFKSWTGKLESEYGPYKLELTRSGSIMEGLTNDSLMKTNIRLSETRFEVAEDYVLYRNGVPYTGDVQINVKGKKNKFSKDGIDLVVTNRTYSNSLKRVEKKRKKQIDRNREKGKKITLPDLDVLSVQELDDNFGYTFCLEFLPSNVLEAVMEANDEEYYYYGNSLNNGLFEGYMLNGKPNGSWTYKTPAGELKREVSFENGELHGPYKEYMHQSTTIYYRDEALRELMNDSLPDKGLWYLGIEATYENDLLEGSFKIYNWLGDIVSEENYKNGLLHGPMLERNNLVCTKSHFKNGLPDGYYQTYLTLPGRDSILLYDLNFQDGSLTGESQTYHINGNLAKRGFFLDGEPIEDYEAFDSLGFKYHYVKFQYSFPIEEKLWEENELSVRYLFNWEDSIIFSPTGMTQTESLDRLVANLGLVDDYLSRPYFGRSTLVSKNEVKCHMTKYYPNDTIARDGDIYRGKKVGLWKYYDYEGELLYEVNYKDSIIKLNDSIRFKSKGVLTDLNAEGDTLYKAHIIEKFERYDCSHTDHYEIRQLYTIWQAEDSVGRMNGYVRNYYDNGVLQNEGELKDGLPIGAWKFYDPFGKLNQYGYYVQGKRDGRWLSGDLSKTKYLGDICLNPNLPDLEKEIKYRENLLDIVIVNYKLGKSLNRQYYDVDMNQFRDVEDEE